MSEGKKDLVVPALGKIPALAMEFDKIRIAESRAHEAQFVNPMTYSELEHILNEAYRDAKRHVSAVLLQISHAEKALEEAKADVLLGKYAEFMQGKPKAQDNADMRAAFFIKDEHYSSALDRLNQMKALESFLTGKIRYFESVFTAMRKKMDLIKSSGFGNSNLYNTQGNK